MKTIFWVLSTVVLTIPTSAFAEQQLSKEEIMALFSGKTVHYTVTKQGINVVAYFDPYGEARELRDGTPDNHPWWVEDDGKHCIQFKGKKKNCKYVTTRADGSYVKYNRKGELRVEYKSFEEGNTNNL